MRNGSITYKHYKVRYILMHLYEYILYILCLHWMVSIVVLIEVNIVVDDDDDDDVNDHDDSEVDEWY